MAARRSSSTDYESFEVGDQVRHPKWGVGSILFKSGSGETAKAIVVFPEQGQKKLMLKYAKLERVQETPAAEEDEFGVEAESRATAEKGKARAGEAEVEEVEAEEEIEELKVIGGGEVLIDDEEAEEEEFEDEEKDDEEEDEEL
jgi:hypothetical protein